VRSWDSPKAQIYRKELQIASDWGTAVIVQKMVYGNLHQHSGTGVALTRAPRQGSQEFQLYGDFIIQGQGDDVVSGLVETQPITEAQRVSQPNGRSVSLEKDFPAVYERLCHCSSRLIKDMSMHHQEIEFTFDGEQAENFHILQSRDHQMLEGSYIQTFVISDELEQAKLGSGVGAGSGALCGRVAHCEEDIERLKAEFPDEPIILIRPDTVPDDINIILRCQGLLTAVGGATSHAAVAAQRLGHTCVVGCRLLQVFDRERRSELAGHCINSGDYLSINGFDGSIYRGKHPISITRTQSLLS
jgi:pyruvate,orthophosphate dikinase